MRRNPSTLLAVTALGLVLAAGTAAAERNDTQPSKPSGAGGQTACRDGTMQKSGPGACNMHGGEVAASQTDPPPAVPPRGTGDETDPANATAQCRDGTFSHAARHAGACGENGGVAKWLDQMPPGGGR